jgi:hypothetical protein
LFNDCFAHFYGTDIKRDRMEYLHLTRDGVAVRVAVGMAECGGNTGFELFGDDVFEAAGLLVDFVPGVAKGLYQPGFEQAVMTDDLEGGALARGSQRRALVFAVFYQRWVEHGQLLDHAGHRSWRNSKDFSQGVGTGRLAVFAQGKDMLEIILDGRGE